QAEDGIRDDLVTGVQTCALPISRFEYLVDVAVEHLARRVAEQSFGGPVPGADLAALGDRVRGVRRLLEQREQLRFEHRSPRDVRSEERREGKGGGAASGRARREK